MTPRARFGIIVDDLEIDWCNAFADELARGAMEERKRELREIRTQAIAKMRAKHFAMIQGLLIVSYTVLAIIGAIALVALDNGGAL